MNTRDKLRIITAANERNRRRADAYISKQMQAKTSNGKQTDFTVTHGRQALFSENHRETKEGKT